MKKIILLILTTLLSFSLFSCSFFEDEVEEYDGCTTVEWAIIWNGLSNVYPSTGTDNPIAAKLREITGVNMHLTFYDGFENDNLSRLFSIGKNMPEVIMAPYWGGGDACSAAIRQLFSSSEALYYYVCDTTQIGA